MSVAPEAGREAQDRFSLRVFRRKQTWFHLDLGLLTSRTVRLGIVPVLSRLVCGTVWWKPQEVNTPLLMRKSQTKKAWDIFRPGAVWSRSSIFLFSSWDEKDCDGRPTCKVPYSPKSPSAECHTWRSYFIQDKWRAWGWHGRWCVLPAVAGGGTTVAFATMPTSHIICWFPIVGFSVGWEVVTWLLSFFSSS